MSFSTRSLDFTESDAKFLEELLLEPVETVGMDQFNINLSHSDVENLVSWNKIINFDDERIENAPLFQAPSGEKSDKAKRFEFNEEQSAEPIALSRMQSNDLLRFDWEGIGLFREKNGANKQESAEPPYTDLDCLCQRGGKASNHPGCQAFLKQKEAMQPRYRLASVEEKYQMSKELVAFVHTRGGRFLRKDNSGKWVEIDDEAARRKASQALRDRSTNRIKAINRAMTSY